MRKTIVPPLKSQGIKTKLVPWIQNLIPETTGKWIEPFLGTGVVAFNASFSNAILSDTNPHIINFYSAIKSGDITPQSVRHFLSIEGEKLRKAEENGYSYYREVKERFNEHKNPLDFLFLSRAGFNGMMRFNKSGYWNIPFCKKPNRFSNSYITKIVNQVDFVSKIIQPTWEFFNLDFSSVINMATKDDIIYCDPPYIHRYADYYNGWDEDDELRLFNDLRSTEAKFILSTWHHNNYRKNVMIDQLWSKFNIVTRDHFYHGGGKIENRRSIVEALVFNFESSISKHNHKTDIQQYHGVQGVFQF